MRLNLCRLFICLIIPLSGITAEKEEVCLRISGCRVTEEGICIGCVNVKSSILVYNSTSKSLYSHPFCSSFKNPELYDTCVSILTKLKKKRHKYLEKNS